MQHSQRFLDLVNDAKSRIRESTVDDVKQDNESGQEFVLADTREESEWGGRARRWSGPSRKRDHRARHRKRGP